ncbi:MAG: hypothetical protein ACLQAT_24270 [Candidatus Binataceae bacterium]
MIVDLKADARAIALGYLHLFPAFEIDERRFLVCRSPFDRVARSFEVSDDPKFARVFQIDPLVTNRAMLVELKSAIIIENWHDNCLLVLRN